MNHQVHIEIERKYEVPDATEVPDLAGVSSIASMSEPTTAILSAVYYDTADLVLAEQRIVLRRRVGGADEGWHIKLPGDEGRVELHWPLGEESPVPEAVLDLVLVHVRDKPLSPVARLTTTRITYCLSDQNGTAIAEVADDLVSAGDVASGQLRVWREWEVELTDDAPGSPKKREALLDAIEERLGAVGARPATSVSKLAHALGKYTLGTPGPNWALSSRSTAGEVLRAAIGSLTERLKQADPLVRQDEPDAVHAMRSSVRRLRSVFSTYRTVLESPEADHIERELKALGAVLGAARDPQAMHDRARNLVRSQANKAMHEVVLTRVVGLKEMEYRRALGYLHRLMSGPRYFRLLDALEEFSTLPSFNATSERPAAKALAKGIASDYRRVKHHMGAVSGATNPAEWGERIHAVRKAARRLRFGVEAVSSGETALFGEKVARLATLAERVQDALGEYRDSELLQHLLLETSEAAFVEGENTFGYGRLHALEQQRADVALESYSRSRGALKDARKWVPGQ